MDPLQPTDKRNPLVKQSKFTELKTVLLLVCAVFALVKTGCTYIEYNVTESLRGQWETEGEDTCFIIHRIDENGILDLQLVQPAEFSVDTANWEVREGVLMVLIKMNGKSKQMIECELRYDAGSNMLAGIWRNPAGDHWEHVVLNKKLINQHNVK